MSKTTNTTAAKAGVKGDAKAAATATPNDEASSAAKAGTGAEAVAGAGSSKGAASADDQDDQGGQGGQGGQGDQGDQGDQSTAQATGGNAAADSGGQLGATHGAAPGELGAAPDTAPAPGKPSSGSIPAWEVLTPFKFKGTVIKPPAWLQLEEEEAKLYQAASVLGTVPAEVPSAE